MASLLRRALAALVLLGLSACAATPPMIVNTQPVHASDPRSAAVP